MEAHKTRLDTFKRIKILQSVFSEHNGIQLEINKDKISRKTPKYLNTLINNSWAKDETKGKLENILICKTTKYNISKFVGCS